VEVKSGETLALGGIFSQKNKTGSDSVPGLSRIPGWDSFFAMMEKTMNGVS
jgi:protein transport protein HofQ